MKKFLINQRKTVDFLVIVVYTTLTINKEDKTMTYTVFPKNEDEMPQDFSTYKEAHEYAEWLEENGKGESVIESTEGEVI